MSAFVNWKFWIGSGVLAGAEGRIERAALAIYFVPIFMAWM
jgi:hypothetical protein